MHETKCRCVRLHLVHTLQQCYRRGPRQASWRMTRAPLLSCQQISRDAWLRHSRCPHQDGTHSCPHTTQPAQACHKCISTRHTRVYASLTLRFQKEGRQKHHQRQHALDQKWRHRAGGRWRLVFRARRHRPNRQRRQTDDRFVTESCCADPMRATRLCLGIRAT